MGSDWIIALPTELPIEASEVLNVCAMALAETVTCDIAGLHTERIKSMEAGWLTSNSAVLDCGAKPCAVTVMR
jgi:hypothetical protein